MGIKSLRNRMAADANSPARHHKTLPGNGTGPAASAGVKAAQAAGNGHAGGAGGAQGGKTAGGEQEKMGGHSKGGKGDRKVSPHPLQPLHQQNQTKQGLKAQAQAPNDAKQKPQAPPQAQEEKDSPQSEAMTGDDRPVAVLNPLFEVMAGKKARNDDDDDDGLPAVTAIAPSSERRLSAAPALGVSASASGGSMGALTRAASEISLSASNKASSSVSFSGAKAAVAGRSVEGSGVTASVSLAGQAESVSVQDKLCIAESSVNKASGTAAHEASKPNSKGGSKRGRDKPSAAAAAAAPIKAQPKAPVASRAISSLLLVASLLVLLPFLASTVAPGHTAILKQHIGAQLEAVPGLPPYLDAASDVSNKAWAFVASQSLSLSSSLKEHSLLFHRSITPHITTLSVHRAPLRQTAVTWLASTPIPDAATSAWAHAKGASVHLYKAAEPTLSSLSATLQPVTAVVAPHWHSVKGVILTSSTTLSSHVVHLLESPPPGSNNDDVAHDGADSTPVAAAATPLVQEVKEEVATAAVEEAKERTKETEVAVAAAAASTTEASAIVEEAPVASPSVLVLGGDERKVLESMRAVEPAAVTDAPVGAEAAVKAGEQHASTGVQQAGSQQEGEHASPAAPRQLLSAEEVAWAMQEAAEAAEMRQATVLAASAALLLAVAAGLVWMAAKGAAGAATATATVSSSPLGPAFEHAYHHTAHAPRQHVGMAASSPAAFGDGSVTFTRQHPRTQAYAGEQVVDQRVQAHARAAGGGGVAGAWVPVAAPSAMGDSEVQEVVAGDELVPLVGEEGEVMVARSAVGSPEGTFGRYNAYKRTKGKVSE